MEKEERKINKSKKQKLISIVNKSTIIMFFLVLIFGIVFPIFDTLKSTLVCSGGETLIENCIYHYGTFMLKSPFLNWFIWFSIFEFAAAIILLVGKLIVKHLSRGKKGKPENHGYKSTEKFERNVSACDYRKWSK
jgi:flagellar biosynthesis/type III secretory pathway M-ring protein FliF/YscJ